MELGSYADGRALTYDESTHLFAAGGFQVAPDQVREEAAAGRLTWASEGISAWFESAFPAGTPVAVPRKRRLGLIVAIVAGVLVLLCGGCALISALAPTTKTDTPAASSPAATTSQSATTTLTPSAQSSAATVDAGPTSSAAEPTAAAPAPTPAPAKVVYKTLSARGFALVAKDPDAHTGETYIIWGEITQFDSATGTQGFRADSGPKKLKPSYGFVNYSQNSVFVGDETMLAPYVQGDLFKAKVTVVGSYSYDTQIGGSTTVPEFEVDSISRYGHVSN